MERKEGGMSTATTMQDVFKSLPMDAAFSRVLAVDARGNPIRISTAIPAIGTLICADANNAQPGFQKTTGKTANLPTAGDGGFLLTTRWDTDAAVQIFISWVTSPKLYIRRQKDAWSAWEKVTTTTVS